MQACVVVIGDSRARGLADSLVCHLEPTIKVEDHACGGDTLDDVYTKLKRSTRTCLKHHHHKCVVVILAGICSLTDRERTQAGFETSFRLSLAENKTTDIKTTIEQIFNYTSDRGIFVIICSIYPGSLVKHMTHRIQQGRLIQRRVTYSEPQLQEQQKALVSCVEEVNDHIKSESLKHSLVTYLNIHKLLEVRSKKTVGNSKTKRKRIISFSFNHLVDGLHPDEGLQNSIRNKIEVACRKLITHPVDASSQSDSECTEPRSKLHKVDTGNFKRPKHLCN